MGSARRLASRRAGPWAPLAGSLRAGQATKDPLPVASVGVADPSQAQDDKSCMKCWEAFRTRSMPSVTLVASVGEHGPYGPRGVGGVRGKRRPYPAKLPPLRRRSPETGQWVPHDDTDHRARGT